MQTDHKSLNKLFAIGCFLFALVLYVITLAPTASFWDPAERIAVAYGIQIPHPPGAPMYILLGRLFSMFMPAESVAYSINMMSALASAGTVMLLYLVVVRLMRTMNGHPDTYDTGQKIAMYGGAIIGALTFAATDSMWFISVEAETYAMSLSFTALVFWLALKWADEHDQPGNERYLIFIAYLIGLAFGIHMLNLLAIFSAALIIYFKKYEFTVLGFLITCVLAVLAFLSIYPGTIIWIPTAAAAVNAATYGLIGPFMFMIIIILILSVGIFYTHKNNFKIANYILVAYTAVLIGFSSYSIIFIRSMSNPPIDQNDPDTVENFTSYMKREQYGSAPLLKGRSYNNTIGDIDRDNEILFPRRHSTQPHHLAIYGEYNSNLDFFWRYQITHMYFRYFGWNFIGRQSDVQDTPSYFGTFAAMEDHKDNKANNFYWYLPFLLGMFGAVFHFVRDWKRALAVLALFVATGLAIILYLNQTPMQPRERDYSFVGSFFAFAIWIGMGSAGVVEMIRTVSQNKYVLLGSLALMYVFIPLKVLSENFDDHDRSRRYVAPDYAYNMLNSVEPYSILFTNGDNDTFPLWYLQEVEGVRTDVRVVNLSLLNTPWYIDQIKNRWNYDSPPVKLSYTDDQIRNIEKKFMFEQASDLHRPQTIRIPINKEQLALMSEGEKQTDQISLEEFVESRSMEWPENIYAPEFSFNMPLEEMDDEVSFFVQGQLLFDDGEQSYYYTRVQDDLVIDIVRENLNLRPIYFAITVASDAQLSMENYFRLEGKAFRIIPKLHEEEYGHLDPDIHGSRLEQFKLRYVNDEKAYFDQNLRRMLDNYRTVITRQANVYIMEDDFEQANYWLEWGEEKIPFTTVTPDLTTILTYSLRYAQANNHENATRLADEALPDFMKELERTLLSMERIELRMQQLEQQLQSPDVRQRVDRRLEIQTRLRNANQQFRSRQREYSGNLSRLIVLQRIYYITGNEEAALDIANDINEMAGGETNFPRTEEENLEHFSRIYI